MFEEVLPRIPTTPSAVPALVSLLYFSRVEVDGPKYYYA